MNASERIRFILFASYEPPLCNPTVGTVEVFKSNRKAADAQPIGIPPSEDGVEVSSPTFRLALVNSGLEKIDNISVIAPMSRNEFEGIRGNDAGEPRVRLFKTSAACPASI